MGWEDRVHSGDLEIFEKGDSFGHSDHHQDSGDYHPSEIFVNIECLDRGESVCQLGS